jgi:hypothetical protein
MTLGMPVVVDSDRRIGANLRCSIGGSDPIGTADGRTDDPSRNEFFDCNDMVDERQAQLAAKAKEKEEEVQAILTNVTKAMAKSDQEEAPRRWLNNCLYERLDERDNLISNLVKIAVSRRYRSFYRLRIMVLRAIQLLLRVAIEHKRPNNPQATDGQVGMLCFRELVEQTQLIEQFISVLKDTLCKPEPVPSKPEDGTSVEDGLTPEKWLSFNALLMISELGQEELLNREVLHRLLDLFQDFPQDLVDVVLRFHAYDASPYIFRNMLSEIIVRHPGGSLLCEVLIQLVNKSHADVGDRKLRATKVLTGCLALPSSGLVLHTTDARVLCEILLREITEAKDVPACSVFVECLKAFISSCRATLEDRHWERLVDVMTEVRDRRTSPVELQSSCSQLLAIAEQQP